MTTVTVIKNSKINIDLNNIDNLTIVNIDADSHKDVVKAKKLLYKWGNPKLPFCVIESNRKTFYVMYSEKEEVTKENILSKMPC